MKRPTEAQIKALRIAAADDDGIRYFKGGWYSVPAALGSQRHPAIGGAYTTPAVIRSSVAAGWLVASHSIGSLSEIYSVRWTLTHAGRAALSAAESAK